MKPRQARAARRGLLIEEGGCTMQMEPSLAARDGAKSRNSPRSSVCAFWFDSEECPPGSLSFDPSGCTSQREPEEGAF
jgi:hypothetical protein